MNLVTPKVGAEHELLFNKLAPGGSMGPGYEFRCRIILNFKDFFEVKNNEICK
jgi:hypothetical protein